MKTVQLHSRVLPETKARIKLIAEANRCQIGAVIDRAVAEYLKNGDITISPPNVALEQPADAQTRKKKSTS